MAREKTNVWRLYHLLVSNRPSGSSDKQIAFYDDGVGASSFRPLYLLGGIFGWGLSRNIRQTYEFLCRHYKPGDKIYLFGFSRGAFTVRVLADFIISCGILNPDELKQLEPRRRFGLTALYRGLKSAFSNPPLNAIIGFVVWLWTLFDKEKAAPQDLGAQDSVPAADKDLPLNRDRGLKRGVTIAYRTYRRHYWKQGPDLNWDGATFPSKIVIIAKWFAYWFRRLFELPLFVRDLWLNPVLERSAFRAKYSHSRRSDAPPVITFMGVWETVDAVGLPIDELADLIDRHIYPYRFLNRNLSPEVKRAAQALSIDDERQTFHPLLWNEDGDKEGKRIKQVWFTGMHSNVGGDYPVDDLACITLDWMIGEINRGPAADRLALAPPKFNRLPIRHKALGNCTIPAVALHHTIGTDPGALRR